MIARTALGAAQLAAGDRETAERNLVAGAHVAERAFLPCARHACSARLAVLWAGRGELGHAERVAQEALRAPTCTGRCGADRRAAAYLALATVSFERDRLAEADRYLDLATNQSQRDPFVAAGVATTRIAVHRARADIAAAYDTLRAARRDRGAIATAYLRERLTVAEAELRIGCGDTAMARALLQPMLDTVGEPPSGPRHRAGAVIHAGRRPPCRGQGAAGLVRHRRRSAGAAAGRRTPGGRGRASRCRPPPCRQHPGACAGTGRARRVPPAVHPRRAARAPPARQSSRRRHRTMVVGARSRWIPAPSAPPLPARRRWWSR